MSRLNASIKLVVLIGDTVFLLLAIITAIFAALVSSGRIETLDFPEARQSATTIILMTLAILGCTIYGCCGAANQIVRKGYCCVGRRILCCHQFLLLGVLILSMIQQKELSNRARSINMVVGNVTNYPTYDSFERRLDQYFNKAYFEGNCALVESDDNNPSSYDKSSEWFMKWIDANCPTTMQQSVCRELSDENKDLCDTTCSESIWSAERCCPSENLCLIEKVNESCPYNQCRKKVLQEVQKYIDPALIGLRFISFLTILMIIFTCLLICYNPRDDIEIELLKTGVMTEEDVETIRKLKSERNFSYDKGNGKGQYSIDLDAIHNQNQTRSPSRFSGGLTQPSKRGSVIRLINHGGGNSRVYPMEMSSP